MFWKRFKWKREILRPGIIIIFSSCCCSVSGAGAGFSVLMDGWSLERFSVDDMMKIRPNKWPTQKHTCVDLDLLGHPLAQHLKLRLWFSRCATDIAKGRCRWDEPPLHTAPRDIVRWVSNLAENRPGTLVRTLTMLAVIWAVPGHTYIYLFIWRIISK